MNRSARTKKPRTSGARVGRRATPRTFWQRRRDSALAEAGLTKADVVRRVREKYAPEAPSAPSIRAVLANRFRDERVHATFAEMVLTGLGDPLANMHVAGAIARYFPHTEPLYRTGEAAEG